MDMWVMSQTLIPGMEHHQRCWLTAQFCPQHLAQRIPGRVKQQAIGLAAIAQHQGRQLVVDYAERFGWSLGGWFPGGSLFAGGLFGTTQRGHCRTGNQSSGLGTESKWVRRTWR